MMYNIFQRMALYFPKNQTGATCYLDRGRPWGAIFIVRRVSLKLMIYRIPNSLFRLDHCSSAMIQNSTRPDPTEMRSRSGYS
jgi:hypothetical protein